MHKQFEQTILDSVKELKKFSLANNISIYLDVGPYKHSKDTVHIFVLPEMLSWSNEKLLLTDTSVVGNVEIKTFVYVDKKTGVA